MGIQGSKLADKKITKTKSNVTERALSNQEITEFASNLNALSSISTSNTDKFDYIVFQKMPFAGKFTPLPFCGTISKSGQSVFICYDCSLNDQAYLCQGCFQKGNHDGHRFSVFPNNAQWNQTYCRCGDYEFMRKNTICQTHKQIKKIQTQNLDKKEQTQFSFYFNEVFKTLYSLKNKQKQHQLLNSFFRYLQKITKNNLYYSKMFCQFLLQKSSLDQQKSNLRKWFQTISLRQTNYFRNLSFATQYKLDILRQTIKALNQNPMNAINLSQLIINFSGKTDLLNQLAKNEDLILGNSDKNMIKTGHFTTFYSKIIKSNLDANQMWKCMIRNKLIPHFISNLQIIPAIIKYLNQENQKLQTELGMMLLQQFLDCHVLQSKTYIIPCLMILAPDCFKSQKISKFKGFDKKIQILFIPYFDKLFSILNTHQRYEQNFQEILLLLPHFSFGEAALNKFWDQFQRRVDILQKNKQKSIIKQGSMNYFQFLTYLLTSFLSWQHIIIQQANTYKFKSYIQNKALIQKLLIQNFEKQKKITRPDLLQIIDSYIQGERSISSDPIKKQLRFNTKKGKYYYIGKKIPNNLFNYEQLNIGQVFKLTELHQIVCKKIFTEKVYKILPKLIKIAQRAIMQDLNMVKVVSNVSIALSLLHKDQKKNLKEVTRNFIKQIPDVKQDVYYVLASIRDRFELDVDEAELSGSKGRKKIKLDLITEIRDKKFKLMKQKQQKAMKEWMIQGQQEINEENQQYEDICHICKQKDSQTNRFVYPCNFTRNNIVSTLLKSEVTDLDINICLHKIHQNCYQKINEKKQCPVCKFKVNCFVPERPLPDESYTKNWLKSFENIVTNINLESGKSFNSDWATIFLTYLVFSRSFKVLLNNTQIQTKQRIALDQTLILHYKNQIHRWPQLTNQAISRAQKTVKGQVRRQSNIKKAVKSLTLDLMIQQITNEPFKNQKRIQKKVRQMINIIGVQNSQKIADCFGWCKQNQAINDLFENNISEQAEHQQLFKIKELPGNAKDYLLKTSIKCPMCGKYQPSTWQCLFCQKISCQNCINVRFHCQREHRGSGIILHLNNAEYELTHQNRQIQRDSLYRNQFEQGWKRNLNPQGWKAKTQQVYKFFNSILHSQNLNKQNAPYIGFNQGFTQRFNRHGGFNNNNYMNNFNNNNFGGMGYNHNNVPVRTRFAQPAVELSEIENNEQEEFLQDQQ